MREINQKIIEDTNSLLLSTLGQLFPNPDRLLPEGWRLKTIEEISKNPQYGLTTSAKSEPIGPKFLRITDIQNGMVDWNTVPFCECNQQEVDRYRLIDGDIVFARTGATTGKTFLISAPPEAVFASYLIRLQIERDASPDFVYWFFQSPYYWRQIIPRGGAQPNMNAQLLKKVKIPVPENPKIQEKIIAQVYSIQNEILQMQKDQNATGKMILDLEQAILAQAFRGEL
jgi:type I restriction enzyme S subunit